MNDATRERIRRIRASITLHVASYTLSDGRHRPVEIAVVRRQRQLRSGSWVSTRAHRIDAGAATRFAARQYAIRLGAGTVVEHIVDHGHLGIFGLDDAGRDDMLRAVRALPTYPSRAKPATEQTSMGPREVTRLWPDGDGDGGAR